MTRTYELREFAFFLPNIKPRKGLSLYCTTVPFLSVELNCAGTRALRPEFMLGRYGKRPPKESPFRSKDAGLYFHCGIFLFMDAPRMVHDALSFPGLLRILSVPPDLKTPVEEAESHRRDSKDQVQGTSGTPPHLRTALVFLGIKIFVTLQNFTFYRGSARHIVRIQRFRFQTDGPSSLTCSSGWQMPTERGERMAQESTGSERTRGAAAWIIVE
ncbi:hypothetical protein ACOSQ4_013343 [Xanthoceras sorbifolium]